MKPFKFKEFQVLQSPQVFRVGTDGVLLGALCNLKGVNKVLEVGTGTGLISLMIAQRNKDVQILALDVASEAVELSKQNFSYSPFAQRLEVKEMDFTSFSSNSTYDLIVSNPPYFLPNSSIKDKTARQQLTLDFPSLFLAAKRNLASEGCLSLIVPKEAELEVLCEAEKVNLFLSRAVEIKGISGGEIRRLVLEFSTLEQERIKEEFTIESAPRVYSEQYLELTKDFHVFRS